MPKFGMGSEAVRHATESCTLHGRMLAPRFVRVWVQYSYMQVSSTSRFLSNVLGRPGTLLTNLWLEHIPLAGEGACAPTIFSPRRAPEEAHLPIFSPP